MGEQAAVAGAGLPLARSAIEQAPPVEASGGWEVSARRSAAALRLADASPLTKLLVRAPGSAPFQGVPLGWARRRDGALVVGTRPGEWMVTGPPAEAHHVAASATAVPADLTHGLALLRLTGTDAPGVLATLCAIDLGDAAAPDGTALVSSVAKVTAEIVRDDIGGQRSFLLACDRSYGQYLFDMISSAGGDRALDIDGFPGWG